MRIRAIAAVACKVLAVYVVLVALDASLQLVLIQLKLANSMAAYDVSEDPRLFVKLGIGVAPGVLLMVGAAVLWLQSDRVAGWMVPKEEASEPDRPVPPGFVQDAQTAALAVIGVVLIARAIPSLVSGAYAWGATSLPTETGVSASYLGRIAVDVLKFAIGVGLVVRAPRVSRCVTWLRTARRSGQRPERVE